MKRFIQAVVVVISMVLAVGRLQAAPDQSAETVFKNLLTAIATNDHDRFVADCDDTMKAAITKEKLDSVSQQVAPRAKDGYTVDYLGELNQKGYEVHLWRLRFKSGGDDVLATLSMKDGKVGGFFLH